MDFVERRNTPRAPVKGTVMEEYLSQQQQVAAVNISEHGMRYRRPLQSEHLKGNEVFLTIALLDRFEPIKALGWVVAERPMQEYIETHVTFMFLPEKDEELIREYVASFHLHAEKN